MKILAYLTLLSFVSSANGQGGLIILVAEPLEFERAEFHFNVCGEEENCLAHGYDGIYLTIDVKEVIYGSYRKGLSIVATTDGFLERGQKPTGSNLHLLLLREVSEADFDKSYYHVIEADPITEKACTVISIDRYISGEVFIAPDAPFYEAEHCYTLEEIRALSDEH